MVSMTIKILSEAEIDQIVIAQADDDSAWEKPIQVVMANLTPLSIPTGLATRAAFLAQLHRKANVEEWLTYIIQERIELEEAAFMGIKHNLLANHVGRIESIRPNQ